MSEKQASKPVVTYYAAKGKQEEAELGLARAFDFLFEEVLKMTPMESRDLKRRASEAELDSAQQHRV